MLEFTTSEAFILAIGSILGGIILLLRGGDWTIDSAVYVARRFGISPMVVGFTIVALGTSLPELVVSVLANLQGSPGIAMGNVIGSNIANILFVIGSTAIFATLATQAPLIKKDLIFMLGATLLLLGLMLYNFINLTSGIIMVSLLLGYILYQYRTTLKGEKEPPMDDDEEPEFDTALMAFVFLLMGLVAIAVGAELLVRGAKVSAEIIGVPEAVIALSVIAFGTSLPELSTCIIAGRKGHSDIVIGNIVGSNVFNILMIIGITSMIKPIYSGDYAAQLIDFDIWVTLGVSVIFAGLLIFYKQINRPIGIAFLGAYILYNIYIYAIYVLNGPPSVLT